MNVNISGLPTGLRKSGVNRCGKLRLKVRAHSPIVHCQCIVWVLWFGTVGATNGRGERGVEEDGRSCLNGEVDGIQGSSKAAGVMMRCRTHRHGEATLQQQQQTSRKNINTRT